MDLAKRDQRIEEIKHLLENRRDFLKNRNNDILESSNDNSYLKDVVNDYSQYYNTLKKQKQMQIAALSDISKHISNSTRNLIPTDYLLQQSKIHQKDIQEKISSIQKDLAI